MMKEPLYVIFFEYTLSGLLLQCKYFFQQLQCLRFMANTGGVEAVMEQENGRLRSR